MKMPDRQLAKTKCWTEMTKIEHILILAQTNVQSSATIVDCRVPGCPGPSKERGTEVRLMRGKIFRGKIRMYLHLYIIRDYDFKKNLS